MGRTRRPHYSDNELAAIAVAIGVEVSRVTQFRAQFDQAVFWFNAADAESGPVPRAALVDKLDQISVTAGKLAAEGRELSAVEAQAQNKPPLSETEGETKARRDIAALRKKFDRTAAKLMRLLGVTAEAAEDGLPDTELEDALVNIGYADGAAIGELVKVITTYRQNRAGAIKAAEELANSAISAKGGTAAIRETTVTPRFRGHPAINGWIDDMLSLYVRITGRKAGTSVRSETDHNAGDADGPLIRFLSAAGKQLGLDFTPHGWRGRIRTAKKAQSQK